jgi:hypothetical protein
MTTIHPRVIEFNEKLKALLTEYQAEFSLEETSRGYCGSTYAIALDIGGFYEGETYVHVESITVGSYVDKETGVLK